MSSKPTGSGPRQRKPRPAPTGTGSGAPPPTAPPTQLKPPTMGSWLKAHWLKAALMGTTAVYGITQVAETNYEYRANGGVSFPGYVAYLLKDTAQDGAWLVGKGSDTLAWAYAGVSGNPNVVERQQDIIFAVPPSLAHMGWESPPPGSKLEAYKREALIQVAQLSRMREEPSSPYYNSANTIFLIRDMFDRYDPHSSKNPPLAEIRTVDPTSGSFGPAGFNRYSLDRPTLTPHLLP